MLLDCQPLDVARNGPLLSSPYGSADPSATKATCCEPGRTTSPLKNRVRRFSGGLSGQNIRCRRRRRGIATGWIGCGYKTASGRRDWLSRDPIGEVFGGMNPYAYCDNDPINWADSLGLEPGENEYTASGKEAHRQFGPGKRLGEDRSSVITDRFKETKMTVEVNELKPAGQFEIPSKVKLMDKQLEKQMDAATGLASGKKNVQGNLWAWTYDRCTKSYAFVKKKGIRWAAKKIPVIGTVVTVFGVAGDVKAKGWSGGLLNSGVDAVPFVGTAKGIVEVGKGEDLIPDKPASGE